MNCAICNEYLPVILLHTNKQVCPICRMAEARRVEEWNANFPEGMPVQVLKDDGSVVHTRTDGPAWLLEGHTAVIKLRAFSGGYSLQRCTPLFA